MPRRLLAPLSLLAALRVADAQQSAPSPPHRREVVLELAGGTAWSLRTPLTVRQPGSAPTSQRARYSTRPLADAPYYAYRVSYGTTAHAVEAELVHHKFYLENPSPPVERLEVTHGYNPVMANVRAPAGRLAVRAGLGVVVAHAEGRRTSPSSRATSPRHARRDLAPPAFRQAGDGALGGTDVETSGLSRYRGGST
jgi:hypothetical protein